MTNFRYFVVLMMFLIGVAALAVASKDVALPLFLLILWPLVAVLWGEVSSRRSPTPVQSEPPEAGPLRWISRAGAELARRLIVTFFIAALAAWIAHSFGLSGRMGLDDFRGLALAIGAAILCLAWLQKAGLQARR